MKIILLNGPPGSGKDFAARIIRDSHPYTVWEKFSMPHKRAFAAIVGNNIDAEGNVEYYEQHKSEIIPWLGVSYRKWQIEFSEDFMKPYYGNDIFARMLIDRLNPFMARQHTLAVVSDCGFQIEVDALLHAFSFSDVLLIRLRRDGCAFIDDSREYVYRYDNGKEIGILNPDDSHFKTRLLDAVEGFLGD